MPERTRTAVLTGVGRRSGIAAAIARGLADDGWNLVLPILPSYDRRLAIGGGTEEIAEVVEAARSGGAAVTTVEADLAEVGSSNAVLDAADALGNPTALVLSHSESFDSSILTTTVESWDRHLTVNARAAWLLIKGRAERLPDDRTTEPRVIAAAIELGSRGLRANVINPGPIDTGWMDDSIRADVLAATPAGRLGTPQDTTDLVRFLLSDAGGWITGQRLFSSGGFHTAG